MNRIRVAFVTNIIPPYRKTFYEKLCSQSAFEWLILRGVQEEENGRPDYKGRIDIPEKKLKNREIKVGPYRIRWQRNVFKYLRIFNPEVLVILGMSGNLTNWLIILWARMKKRKLVIWACGWESQKKGSLYLKIKQAFMYLFYLSAERILVYSTKDREYFKGLSVDPEKLIVCYNGIEIDHLAPREELIRTKAIKLREEEGADKKKVFLYVGGMLREKEVDLLVEAFADLHAIRPDAVLWLVGDGPDRKYFEELAAVKGIRDVKFWGRIIDEADQFFAAADFFVLPGVGGLALNQAMFWGIPCIGTEADGTDEDLIIDGVTGMRFLKSDKASLFNAMRACVELGAEQRKTYGDNCSSLIVNQSNVSEMVETFSNTLKSITPVQ